MSPLNFSIFVSPVQGGRRRRSWELEFLKPEMLAILAQMILCYELALWTEYRITSGVQVFSLQKHSWTRAPWAGRWLSTQSSVWREVQQYVVNDRQEQPLRTWVEWMCFVQKVHKTHMRRITEIQLFLWETAKCIFETLKRTRGSTLPWLEERWFPCDLSGENLHSHGIFGVAPVRRNLASENVKACKESSSDFDASFQNVAYRLALLQYGSTWAPKGQRQWCSTQSRYFSSMFRIVPIPSGSPAVPGGRPRLAFILRLSLQTCLPACFLNNLKKRSGRDEESDECIESTARSKKWGVWREKVQRNCIALGFGNCLATMRSSDHYLCPSFHAWRQSTGCLARLRGAQRCMCV
jgi:hypothetical protein